MPLSICVAGSANWPEYGMISPILTGPWARAGDATTASAATTATAIARMGLLLGWAARRRACREIVLARPGREQECPSHRARRRSSGVLDAPAATPRTAP